MQKKMSINRTHIGLFGLMNAGKSSIMNLITMQETSIVDETPGTTADVKISLIELHGLGPVKIFDTPGIDEENTLGEKKRGKTLSVLKECDLAVIVINPRQNNLDSIENIITEARELDKQILIVYNLFDNGAIKFISNIESTITALRFYKKIKISAINSNQRPALINFILQNFTPLSKQIELMPFLKKDSHIILNIPMDEETPEGRFLRPQSMAVEYITRNFSYATTYRMDLKKARSNDSSEQARFVNFIENFKRTPDLIITDSQAMDIMSKWTPDNIGLTTFSIMMINYMSNGRLNEFINGTMKLDELKPGDKILIAEACNHSRIAEDIGTVQIPSILENKYPGVKVEFCFGREFDNIKSPEKYKLIIHCGGCMITPQKISARLRDLTALGIPYTNYGLFLSYAQNKAIFEKVISPWFKNS